MTGLESIVLPLVESQNLIAAHIILPTALVWILSEKKEYTHVESRAGIEMVRRHPELDRLENGATIEERGMITVGAPVFTELMSAIQAKRDEFETKTNRGMLLQRSDYNNKILWEVVGQGKSVCEDDWLVAQGEGSSDLFAAYQLLMEVNTCEPL